MTSKELVNYLDRRFPGEAPGGLTERLRRIPEPDFSNASLERRVAISMLSSRRIMGSDQQTERRVAEVGMLGQIDGRFMFNFNPMIQANGLAPTASDRRELAGHALDVLIRNGLFKAGDSVLDACSGFGDFALLAERKGIFSSVNAFEMDSKLAFTFPATVLMTSREYVQANPGKKFSVVHAGNFSPTGSGNYIDMDVASEMAADFAAMTHSDGSTLVCLSSNDAQFPSGKSDYRLRPVFERAFGSVEYLSAKKLGEEFSFGGQIGLFKCSRPMV